MRLMIACPITGDAVAVGSNVDRDSLVALPSIAVMKRPCSSCCENHVWRMVDAWLEDEWRSYVADETSAMSAA